MAQKIIISSYLLVEMIKSLKLWRVNVSKGCVPKLGILTKSQRSLEDIRHSACRKDHHLLVVLVVVDGDVDGGLVSVSMGTMFGEETTGMDS